MHRARIFAFTLPVLCTLGACVAACEDSSNPPVDITLPDGALPDGSLVPGADAALPDGAVPDAEAGPQGFSVLVVDGLTPKSGIRVIFHDATGAPTGGAMTDATGTVVSATTPSMVTVLTSESATDVNPVTFMGLTGGETLRVAVRHPEGEPSSVGSVSVTHTPNALIANATIFYSAFGSSGCGNNASNVNSPIVAAVYPYCITASNTVLTTANDTNGNPLAFAFMKNVPAPTNNGTVNVGPLAFTDKGTRTLTASNLLDPEQYSSYVNAFAVVATSPFSLPSTGDIHQPAGVTFTTPVAFADAFQSELNVEKGVNGYTASTRIVRREAASAAATGALTSFDFNETLPLLQGFDVSTTASVARPVMTVTTAAVTGAHTGLARIRWFGETSGGQWTFVFPGELKTITAPALPADASTFAPHDDVGPDTVFYVDGPLVPDFGAAKKLPIPTEGDVDLLDSSIALPVNGKLLVTTLIPGRG